MAAPTEAQVAHLALLDEIDIHSIHKSFRAPNWRPNHRRNKNIKTIITDASRKEASSSIAATPMDDSGAATPMAVDSKDDKNDGLSTSGASTPAGNGAETTNTPNLAQASRSLSKLVLEKSLRQGNSGLPGGGIPGGLGGANVPGATYTNIESAPSLAHRKHYCDVTGLPAPYLDPKTRMRYHDREVFSLIRTLPQGVPDQYLEARGAHVVLK